MRPFSPNRPCGRSSRDSPKVTTTAYSSFMKPLPPNARLTFDVELLAIEKQ